MERFKTAELDINEFVRFAESHVGETHDLEYQTFSKRGEPAGKYEIIGFEPLDNPHFEYRYWKHAENDTPDNAELGYYYIKISDSKFYNGKTIKARVVAYVQTEDKDGNYYKTKALYIYNVNEETGKGLKAYQFGILDFRVKA